MKMMAVNKKSGTKWEVLTLNQSEGVTLRSLDQTRKVKTISPKVFRLRYKLENELKVEDELETVDDITEDILEETEGIKKAEPEKPKLPSKKELRAKAKKLGLKRYSKLSSEELAELIAQAENGEEEEKPKSEPKKKKETKKKEEEKSQPATGDMVTLKEICEELGIDPRKARVKLRKVKDVPKPHGSWKWDNQDDINTIKGMLK